MSKSLPLFFGIIFFISCSGSQNESVDLLIRQVHVINIEDATISNNQVIGINKDTIAFIKSAKGTEGIKGKEEINANGGFIMPGLWDNHVHFRGGDSIASENKNLLPLYLRYGITTVKDAGGDLTPQILEWRNKIEDGSLVGPSIFTPGPKLDGENPAWAGSIKVTQSTDVTAALNSLQSLGVDFVKIYDGSLTADMYYDIIKKAEDRGLKVTGHMPLTANISTAIGYGLDGSEHMYYIMKGCSALEDSLSKSGMGYSIMPEVVKTYNDSIAKSLFNTMAAKKVFVTPTLYIGKTLSQLADVDHSNDSLLPYIGEGIQETYKRRVESAKRAKASGNTSRQTVGSQAKKMIKPMFEAGVPILAGSDCGPYNSFVYPGEALHGELQMLVEAGLTPQEALLTSTVNGSKFFGLENNYKMETGNQADLLILTKNPLNDISNLTTIQAVIKNGNYFNTSTLDEMLEQIN